jgi:siroheme synthase-like protein
MERTMAPEGDYYPVMLNLTGERCLVVGGGSVALRKVKGLLAAGAQVSVVAPLVDERLKTLKGLEIQERPFRTTDLHHARLVVVATDDATLNRTVARDARDLGVLVNVVDCPALCSFILPATLKEGPVQVSVSTGGSSPTLARKLRDTLQASIGPEYGTLAQILGEVRAQVIERVTEPEARARLFDRLGDEEFLALVRRGETDKARAEMQRLIDEAGR